MIFPQFHNAPGGSSERWLILKNIDELLTWRKKVTFSMFIAIHLCISDCLNNNS